jgi:hypothetical protein
MFAAPVARARADAVSSAPQSSTQVARPEPYADSEHEADPPNLMARGAMSGVSWDFSKISIFPPDGIPRAASHASTGHCACGGTCPDCTAKSRLPAPLHRCPADASCDQDEARLQREGFGDADCNPGLGKPEVHVSEFCASDCVRQHEQAHADDYAGCCSVYSACWHKASSDADRRRCTEQWYQFMDANRDRFECNAYRVEVQCLKDFIGKNCSKSGGPVGDACCQTLFGELDTATKRATEHCSKATEVPLPCGLYLKSADSRPGRPSDATGAEGEAAGTAMAVNDTATPPTDAPS